jgi:hypothetical protein
MRNIICLQSVDEEGMGNFNQKTRKEEREILGNLGTNGKKILNIDLRKGERR